MQNQHHTDRPYFERLDFVRFLAAFMILVLHVYDTDRGAHGHPEVFTSEGSLHFVGTLIDQFIDNLHLGVDVFFLVSGFLITFLLLDEKKRTGTIAIGAFLMRRIVRIWPLYFLLIATAPFLVSWLEMPAPNYLRPMLFINNWDVIVTGESSYPFGHLWSIAIEMQFYFIWPFVIKYVPTKRLLLTCLSLVGLTILFRMYTSGMHHGWFHLCTNTLSRIDVLIIGAIAGYYHSQKPLHFSLKPFVRFGLIAVLFYAMATEPIISWSNIFLMGFKKYFYIAIVAVLLLDFNFNTALMVSWSERPPLKYLGRISYGTYIINHVFILVVLHKILPALTSQNTSLFYLIAIVGSLALSVVSFELFEKPLLKLGRRFRK